MLIVFSSDEETIVTDSEHEAVVLKEWFIEGDRNLDDYDREECETCVAIDSKLSTDTT